VKKRLDSKEGLKAAYSDKRLLRLTSESAPRAPTEERFLRSLQEPIIDKRISQRRLQSFYVHHHGSTILFAFC
jgi:hypothetical protein